MYDYFKKDYIGKAFSVFEVIDIEQSEFSKKPLWKIKCRNCSNKFWVLAEHLVDGIEVRCGKCDSTYSNIEKMMNMVNDGGNNSTISCGNGCMLSYKDRQRLRKIRDIIINRCYNEKYISYHLYGGIGISVVKEWRNSLNEFINWSINNGYKSYLNLKRKNKLGDYSPLNCYWGNKDGVENNIEDIQLDKYMDIGINYELLEKDIKDGYIDKETIYRGIENIKKVYSSGNIDKDRIVNILKRVNKQLMVYRDGLRDIICTIKSCRYFGIDIEGECDIAIQLMKDEYNLEVTSNKIMRGVNKYVNNKTNKSHSS